MIQDTKTIFTPNYQVNLSLKDYCGFKYGSQDRWKKELPEDIISTEISSITVAVELDDKLIVDGKDWRAGISQLNLIKSLARNVRNTVGCQSALDISMNCFFIELFNFVDNPYNTTFSITSSTIERKVDEILEGFKRTKIEIASIYLTIYTHLLKIPNFGVVSVLETWEDVA